MRSNKKNIWFLIFGETWSKGKQLIFLNKVKKG